MNRCVKSIFLAAILLLPTKFYAERLTVYVDGESYSRQMPDNLEDCQALIRELVKMQNTSDNTIVEIRKISVEQAESLSKQISQLKEQLDAVSKSAEDATDKVEDVQKDIDSIHIPNSRLISSFFVGPVFKKDFEYGLMLGIGGNYRLIGNFYVGGMGFLNTFNDSSFQAGFAASIGYSFK